MCLIERLEIASDSSGSGLLVLSFSVPIEPSKQRALATALVRAKLVKTARNLPKGAVSVLALPYRAPLRAEAEAKKAALETIGGRFGVNRAWGLYVAATIVTRKRAPKTKRSSWRNGPLPQATTCPFPIDGYPDIIEEFDWEDFGIAVKLGGRKFAGEKELLQAFHEFWLAPYFDPHSTSHYLPYRHADVEWDARRRSAVLWVDRFVAPASAEEIVRHLLFVVSRLAEVVPIVHARFGGADIEWKYRALTGDETEPFVLAGNPLLGIFERAQKDKKIANAKTWIANDKIWSKKEKAAMVMEILYGEDPEDRKRVALSLLLTEIALALEPNLLEAKQARVRILLAHKRAAEALALVRRTRDDQLTLVAIDIALDKAPSSVPSLVRLLRGPAFGESEALADLVVRMAEVSKEVLPRFLSLLPDRSDLIPYLYNASFKAGRSHLNPRKIDRVARGASGRTPVVIALAVQT